MLIINEAPKALAAERPRSKTNKDRDHFEYFLAFLKRFKIIISCDCKNYKRGLVRATLCHGLPPQFLLLFRSKFKKREEEFIQKQRKVHYRNSERYCDFSWTTMYKCAIQLHVCFRLNHAVEILFQKRAENIQKSPKTCRRFLLSKMYGKIYRKALQDAVHLSSVSKRCGKMHRNVPKYVVALFCQKRVEK